MEDWLEDQTNRNYVMELRECLSDGNVPVFIFLGAGLSFGVDRGRAMFERHEYEDDGRFPSWSQLVKRMETHLLSHPILSAHQESLKRFFKEQGALDCAELFQTHTQGPNYWEFLRRQFASKPGDHDRLTASHQALTRLPVKELFTTNYDELIETAYNVKGVPIRVSSSPKEFLDNVATQQDIHLVKLHGTIQHPDTIVFTRSDYARSRLERSQMFNQLVGRFQFSTFLFVGFSLTDPNFNILFDEAHYVRQGQNPVSYVVQGHRDQVYDSYLGSMGVNTISLGWWEDLPDFLQVINPESDLKERLGD